MKYLLIICLFLTSCYGLDTGRFVSTDKPIVVLGKTHTNYRSTTYYIHVYLNKPINVKVSKDFWDSYEVGDTIRNVAVVID